MSFDLAQDDIRQQIASTPLTNQIEPGVWTGFFSGAAKTTMQGFASLARGVDLLGAVGPIAMDKISGGTTQQDKYFQEHDDVFNRAVDYWTPKPTEVGLAGRIVGGLLSTLPVAMVSPAMLAINAGASTSEELLRQGVDLSKALAAGAFSGAAMGIGINLPFFGKTLAAKMATGAAGNLALGVGERGATSLVLSGTEAGKNYHAFDVEGMLLDTLMGAGFGGVAHYHETATLKKWDSASPIEKQKLWTELDARTQKVILERDFGSAMTESQKAAVLAANAARHLGDTTAPGRAADPVAATVHVEAMTKAVDDLLNGRAVNVEQSLDGVKFDSNEQKAATQHAIMTELREEARTTVNEAILTNEALRQAEEIPGFLRTPEQMVRLREGQQVPEGATELQRAVEIANKPGFQRTAEEKVFLDTVLKGKAFEELSRQIEQQPTPADTLRGKIEELTRLPSEQQAASAKKTVESEPVDPLIADAQQRIANNPELADRAVIENEDGTTTTLADAAAGVEQARKDAPLFEVAAQCLLGIPG